MSKKTFGALLKIAVGTVLIASGNPAGVFLLGSAVRDILPGTFGAILAGLGGAVGLAGFFLTPKGRSNIDATVEIGGRLNIRQDPNAFRNVLIGTAATAGVLRYKNLIEGTDDEPDILWLVVVLAGYPCDGLDSFIFNGETITVNGDGSTAGAFAGKLFVYFRKGDETDHAFPALVDGVWDAKARRGRGLCCAAIKIINDEVFEGKVEPVFVVRGAKLFDPRQDTAWGGSGTHDFGDDTTFEHSDNPSEAKLTFLRGFYIQDSGANDVLIAGRGLKDKETTRFDFANWIASANTDEDQIPVVGGGNIDRYTANGIIHVSRSPADTIKILDAAQAGTTVFSGGKYRSYPGIYRAPTLTFGEADIIGVPRRLDIRRGQDSVVNIVSGSFSSAADRYELRDYPRQKDAASITRVGEMQQDLNLPFTTDHRMAQRIALISMRQANAQRSFTATFSHRALRLAPGGETVQINYPHFDFVNEVMRVTTWALIPAEDNKGMPGLTVDMVLVQDLSSFYSWTAGTDEQSITTPGQMPGAIGPGALTVRRINGFNERRTYIKFDGSINGSRLEVADDPAWDFEASEAGTWEWWGFVDDPTVGNPVWISKDFTGVNAGWGSWIDGPVGTWKIRAADGAGSQDLAHQDILVGGRWYHFAFTRSVAGVINSYLDGVPSDTTITENDTMANAEPLQFMARASTLDEMTGRMRDVRRWSTERTQQEFIDNRFADLVGDETGLIGFWPFREATGRTAFQGADAAPADSDAIFQTAGPTWGGVVGESMPNVESALTDSGNLQDGVAQDQGDTELRAIVLRGESGFAGDGDVITFNVSFPGVPKVVFRPGGITTDSGLTGDVSVNYEAENLTAAGFTASFLLKELAGTPTLHTDTGPDVAGATWDREMEKVDTAPDAAWDNKYTYQFDGTVENINSSEPGQFTAAIYIKLTGGGAWLRVGQKTVFGSPGSQQTVKLNETVTITQTGVTDFAGVQFAVHMESSEVPGSTVDNLDSVKYSTATAPSEADAVPVGASDVEWEASWPP